jgi:hypothetical protein
MPRDSLHSLAMKRDIIYASISEEGAREELIISYNWVTVNKQVIATNRRALSVGILP